MTRRGTVVHVVTTRRRYNGKVYQTHLLRRSYREGTKVRNETLANLSHLSDAVVELIRRGLRGEQLCAVQERFEVIASRHHGHVEAVLTTMKRLGFETLIASRHWRERDRVMAMVGARILAPRSKLAATRWWSTTTLPALLGLDDATEDDCYAAMDWLLERQGVIEKKLAVRHLKDDALVLYDLTSSYFEGLSCPLAARGHDRDGKRGKLQANYGLLTNAAGIPVSVSVFKDNTADSTTVLGQVDKLREKFGLHSLVLVGDRGMISQKRIDALREVDGMQWITALRSAAIRELVEPGHVQLGLFDQRNLFELTHQDYPGERLVACRNPELAKSRAYTRQSLLAATVRELDIVCGMVKRGRLKG